VLILDYPHAHLPGVVDWEITLDALMDAHRETGTPTMVLSSLSELLPEAARARAIAGGVAPLQGMEEGIRAIADAAWYGERRQAIDPAAAARLVPTGPAAPDRAVRTLDEWDSKQRLAAAGLAVPEGRCVTAAEAPAAARALGFPVAVKALDARLAHKTEAGAVALMLRDEAAVEAAVARIGAALAGLPGAGDRFLVERMVEGAVAELIVGIQRDPQFGLALVVGAGGLQVELAADSRLLLLPCGREDMAAALDSLKAARLLAGFRGRPEGDREAVLDAMQAVADFAESQAGHLAELDVNPLMVLPRGQGVVAADALVLIYDE